MGRAKSFLLLLLFLLVSVSFTVGQMEGVRGIAGSIRVGEGRLPDQRARVRLLNSSGALQQEVYAETSGGFAFSRLPAGDYTVEVALIGFQTARQAVSVLSLPRYRAVVLVTL